MLWFISFFFLCKFYLHMFVFCVFVQARPQSVPYREALSNRRILTSSTESREGLTQQVKHRDKTDFYRYLWEQFIY